MCGGWGGVSLENTGEGGGANCHLKKKNPEIYHKIHFP